MNTAASITQQRVARYRKLRQWTITVAIWVAVALVAVAVVPTFGQLAGVTARLHQQAMAGVSLASVRQASTALTGEVERLERATAALHEPGTAEQQVAGLVADVRRLGHLMSLGEVGWTPGDHPQRIDGLSLLPFQLHVSGDYGDAQKFMAALQALPRPIRLHDVEFDSSSPGSGHVELRMTVDLVTAENQ